MLGVALTRERIAPGLGESQGRAFKIRPDTVPSKRWSHIPSTARSPHAVGGLKWAAKTAVTGRDWCDDQIARAIYRFK